MSNTNTKELVFLNEKVVKKLFKNEKYGKILSAKLISDLLDADYDDIYNNLYLSTDEIAFSSLTVNSTADTIYHNDSIYFNIELNFSNYKSKNIQLESYVFQLFLSQLHSYKNYNNLKKIIQISIDGFDYFHQNEFIYKVFLMEEKYHLPYNDLIELVHINIDFLRKLDYTKIVDNKLMKDLYFLTCNEEDKIDDIYKGDKLMKDIINEAEKIAGFDKMDLFLTDEEMMRQDEEFFRNEGIKETQIQVIKNMLKKNMSLNDISEIVNLSITEVEKIIKSLKKN